jgi:N-acyl-phosphatidylethanolamine-hydrolysing phospholipase D
LLIEGGVVRQRRRVRVVSAALLLAVVALVAASLSRAETSTDGRAHHFASGFRNQDPAFARASAWIRLRHLVQRLPGLVFGERLEASLPSVRTDVAALRDNGHDATITWIGHSTLLVQLDGVNFLTDPHWGDATGPFGGRIGIRRYTPPGLAFDDLPPIDFVIISHDHYDHLDEPTVRRLARARDPVFVVPLGIKAWLADIGITKAVELDWGESTTVRGLTVVCTPAQHFSGRGVHDQGRRLWASWVVSGSKRFYFGGDSGYYRHFKEIGDAYGPFDLAALPIGSYTPRATTRAMHTSPEEALQAWLDLRAARFVGIHWGTFALAQEPYDDPPRRLAAEVTRRGIAADSIWVLKPGETRHW